MFHHWIYDGLWYGFGAIVGFIVGVNYARRQFRRYINATYGKNGRH